MTNSTQPTIVIDGIENHDATLEDGFDGDAGANAVNDLAAYLQQEPINQHDRFPAPVIAVLRTTTAAGHVSAEALARNTAWWLRKYADAIEKNGLPVA
jgi:hypothetical protein